MTNKIAIHGIPLTHGAAENVQMTACRAKRVITYQYAYVTGSVELCDACASAWRGPALGPVSHGLHSAACGTRR